jgi:hypothetical protein
MFKIQIVRNELGFIKSIGSRRIDDMLTEDMLLGEILPEEYFDKTAADKAIQLLLYEHYCWYPYLKSVIDNQRYGSHDD